MYLTPCTAVEYQAQAANRELNKRARGGGRKRGAGGKGIPQQMNGTRLTASGMSQHVPQPVASHTIYLSPCTAMLYLQLDGVVSQQISERLMCSLQLLHVHLSTMTPNAPVKKGDSGGRGKGVVIEILDRDMT